MYRVPVGGRVIHVVFKVSDTSCAMHIEGCTESVLRSKVLSKACSRRPWNFPPSGIEGLRKSIYAGLRYVDFSLVYNDAN